MEIKVTNDLLPILGVILPFLFWLVPGLKTWYDGLRQDYKQLVAVGILFVIAVGSAGLSAAGVLHLYVGTVWTDFVWPPLVDFIIAVVAMSGVYKSVNYSFIPKSQLTERPY